MKTVGQAEREKAGTEHLPHACDFCGKWHPKYVKEDDDPTTSCFVHQTILNAEEVLKHQYDLIAELKKVNDAMQYDGEASVQVLLPTREGKWLRVGVTDPDVAAHPGIWFDYYPGLPLASGPEFPPVPKEGT